MYVPGSDGEKMSKSKGNIIDIFLPDKQLRKQIMKIKTDSTPMEEPKDPDTCNLFALYKLLANEEQLEEMRANYQGRNYGYGQAKQAFYELILDKFGEEREKYHHFMSHPKEIDAVLMEGANKASAVADNVLDRVREKLGY
jgi:tryptophanyl-tRNA synthetase